MIKEYWFKTEDGFEGVYTGGGCIEAVKKLQKDGHYDIVLISVEEYPGLYIHGLREVRRIRPIGPQREAKKRKKL